MTKLIEWLESNNTRTRKFITVFTAMVWLLAVIFSYGLSFYGFDTIGILSLITAQFSAIVGFYMATKADTD